MIGSGLTFLITEHASRREDRKTKVLTRLAAYQQVIGQLEKLERLFFVGSIQSLTQQTWIAGMDLLATSYGMLYLVASEKVMKALAEIQDAVVELAFPQNKSTDEVAQALAVVARASEKTMRLMDEDIGLASSP